MLKNAGDSNNLPDFDDHVIANAIKRLLVGNASEKLLREQAKNMVMTEEELDFLASMKVKARTEGRAEGLAEGREQEHLENQADTKAVLQELGLPEEKIAEMQTKLEALRQKRLAQK